MPTPQKGESRDDFLDRCIPMLVSEGKPRAQAVAICSSMYSNKDKKESP